MDSQGRQPQTDERPRVIDLRADGRLLLDLGNGLAAVFAKGSQRSAAARWIAATAAGPPPGPGDPGSDGVDLPAAEAAEPAVVDREHVRAAWQLACALRRDEMAAEHAAARLERHRIEAALERARWRASVTPVVSRAPAPCAPEEQPEAGTAAGEPAPGDPSPGDPDGARDPAAELAAFRAAAAVHARIASLLTAVEALEPAPSDEALHLADLWDANAALLRERETLGEQGEVDVEGAERRVHFARLHASMAAGAVGEARTELERRHRAVVAAESELFEAGRRQRADSLARYEAAVAAEREALANAGVDSYASFLLGVAAGGLGSDEESRRVADAELTQAIETLDAARRGARLPPRTELEARAAELHTRARVLLRAHPGDDVGAALRAQRIEQPGRAAKLRELESELVTNGIDPRSDTVRAARDYLASPPTLGPRPRDAATAPAPSPSADRAPERHDVRAPQVPLAEIEALEQQVLEQERLLTRLERRMARLDAMRGVAFDELAPDEIVLAMTSTLDAHRTAPRDARRALVLDGVLDGLAADRRDAAVETLARAEAAPVIVVSGDPRVVQCVAEAGGTAARWSGSPGPVSSAR